MTPYIADFYIHSHYSRATSKALDFEHLDYWARLKDIKVVGTGFYLIFLYIFRTLKSAPEVHR